MTIMPRKRARTSSGEFLADDPSTPSVNEAWVETPDTPEVPMEITTPAPEETVTAEAASVVQDPVVATEEPQAPAPAPEKQAVETSVRKKLDKRTDSADPFVPQNSAQLEVEAKQIAKEKGFELNRGTSIGARLMARRRLG